MTWALAIPMLVRMAEATITAKKSGASRKQAVFTGLRALVNGAMESGGDQVNPSDQELMGAIEAEVLKMKATGGIPPLQSGDVTVLIVRGTVQQMTGVV